MKINKHRRSIIYVNFSPYDNAGHILDFLLTHFDTVIHFSFDHLRLQNGRRTNLLTVYNKGEIFEKRDLLPLRTPPWLRFPSLPAVAILIFHQTWWHSRRLNRQLGTPDYYLSVNAYTACIGNFLRNWKHVKRTVFWVWDYYPKGYPDWKMRLIRSIYWRFDKPGLTQSDIIVAISKKLITLRYKLGVLPLNKTYKIIPIGTDPIDRVSKKGTCVIGFLGMLKISSGLDLLIDSLTAIKKKYPKAKVEIIGSGPDEQYFRARTRRFGNTITFHGFIDSNDDVKNKMKNWTIGIATYLPHKSNESQWTDPSKIKAYLSAGVPVVTTHVPQFAREIKKHNAGMVIDYQKNELLRAITTIEKMKNVYARNALALSKKFSYHKLYKHFF